MTPTNCVNCGAPPEHGATTCPYCRTALSVPDPHADTLAFTRALQSLRPMRSDFHRQGAVKTLRGPFTPGQTRALLTLFSSDYHRENAADHLVLHTTNPGALTVCANLFQSDYPRLRFLENLGDAADDGDVDTGYAEPELPSTPRTSRSIPGWAGGLLLLLGWAIGFGTALLLFGHPE